MRSTNIDDLDLYTVYVYLEILKINKNALNGSDRFTTDMLLNKLKDYYYKALGKDENDEETLMNWARNIYRYRLLSDLLKNNIYYLTNDIVINNIKIKDLFMVDNFDAIMDLIKKCIMKNCVIEQSDYPNPSSLSKELRNEYIEEILEELDPSLELLNIYKTAVMNKRIIYLNEYSKEDALKILKKYKIDDIDYNGCLLLKNGPLIILSNENKIRDLKCILHEFAHYLNFIYNCDGLCPTLDEYFSITFELYSLIFLQRKGYDIEEIRFLYEDRAESNFAKFLHNNPLFYYFKLCLDNKEVREDNDIEYFKPISEVVDIKKLYYQLCDKYIKELIEDLFILEEEYSYLIGFTLAYMTIKMYLQNPNIINDLIKYIKSNEIIDPYDIFELAGVDIKNLGIKRTRIK